MNKHGLNLKIKKEGLTSENIKLFADLYNLNFLSSNDLSFVSEQYFNDRNNCYNTHIFYTYIFKYYYFKIYLL